MESPYHMTISLNTLRHLGENLYKNIPKAVSEAVANSWDAEAEEVRIELDTENQEVIIADDGNGMSKDDINRKLLTVGYRKRDNYGDKSNEKERKFMGRKGIGKLALFSLAKEVTIFTKKDGCEPQGLRIDIEEIEELIENENPNKEKPYTPDDVRTEFEDNFPDDIESGTVIILGNIEKNITGNTMRGLKKRLARRFAVLGEDDFDLYVEGDLVRVTDKDYFHKADFMWFVGDPSEDQEDYYLDESTPDSNISGRTHQNRKVHGWIASVERPSDLNINLPDEETEAEDINKIHLMVRGKMGKGDLMEVASTSNIVTNYLFGEIYADWMDDSDLEDIHATDREEFQESERTRDLKQFIDRIITEEIRPEWDEYREKKKMEKVKRTEAWKEVLSDRDPEERKVAESFLKKFAARDDVTLEQMERLADFASENIEYQSFSNIQEELVEGDADPDLLVDLFERLQLFDAIETLRVTIGRMVALVKFQEMIEKEAKEVPDLQEHLADNPFLLDPSWDYQDERVSKSQAFDDYEPDEEKNEEVDIIALEWGRQLLIVELKRPGRPVGMDEFSQLQGYVSDYETRKADYDYDSVRGVLIGNNFQDSALSAVANTDNIDQRSLDDIKSTAERQYGRLVKIFEDKAQEKDDRRLKNGLLRFKDFADRLGLDIEEEINDFDGRKD